MTRVAVLVLVSVSTAVLSACGSDAPSPSPPSVSAASPSTRPALYTVASTWVAGEDTGGGVSLVVPSESRSQAQAAVVQYMRSMTDRGRYVWVQVLGHADATEWICAGEFVPSEAEQKRYAVFPMTKAIVNFPGEWVQCR